jgi:hypothetical protein
MVGVWRNECNGWYESGNLCLELEWGEGGAAVTDLKSQSFAIEGDGNYKLPITDATAWTPRPPKLSSGPASTTHV